MYELNSPTNTLDWTCGSNTMQFRQSFSSRICIYDHNYNIHIYFNIIGITSCIVLLKLRGKFVVTLLQLNIIYDCRYVGAKRYPKDTLFSEFVPPPEW